MGFMTRSARPPAAPGSDAASREARLAEALRANLRRRKAAARAAEPGLASDSCAEDADRPAGGSVGDDAPPPAPDAPEGEGGAR